MTIDLGKRIRYFRERAGLKQEDIELQAGFAQGLMSRIENNKINPSKETIRKITGVLKLNHRELDYLIGITAVPATQEEIDLAIKEVKEYFKTRGLLAYLVDDRARFLYFSDTFSKLSGFSKEKVQKVINHTVIEIILDKSLGVRSLLDQKYYEQIVEGQLRHYYSRVFFMQDDKYFKRSMRIIFQDPMASSLMTKIQRESRLKLLTFELKKIYFDFNGKYKIGLNYSREPLMQYPRFYIVEYIPNNKILRLLSKLG